MSDLILHTISGPVLPDVPLDQGVEFSLGRSSNQKIRLNDPSVSRHHANLSFLGGRWMITDLGSRHGTQINGIALAPETPTHISVGDRVAMGPWTLAVRSTDAAPSTLVSVDDTTQRNDSVTRIAGDELGTLAERRLTLLMNSAKSIHRAADEQHVATCAVEALVTGTGYGRCVFVRPARGVEELDVLAICPALPGGVKPGDLKLSRSLIKAARSGIVKLEDNAALQQAVSIISFGVAEAICAPIMVGDHADAFVYLDSPAGSHTPQPDAAAFCSAIADLASLSIANIRSRKMAARQLVIEHDLESAREAQNSLLPPTSGVFGKVVYARYNKPGRFVAGDLFGIADAGEGLTGVFIGDVTGKGLGASVLMAAIHPRLTAWLEAGMNLVEAVQQINTYVESHSPDNVFVTMWLAMIDANTETAICIDAGHGLAAVIRDGTAEALSTAGGLPIGVDSEYEYEMSEISFKKGDRLILFSDGVIEQRSSGGEELGFDRVLKTLESSSGMDSDIASIIDQLSEFAGTDAFADDVSIATIALEQ